MQPRRLAIGKRLCIISGGAVAEEGRLAVIVEAGAFGSGEHVTTATCLELLEDLPALAGGSVLDVGCGTGILGLAALRLGARRALLLDLDPAAAATAARNCARNGLAGRATVVAGDLAALGESRHAVILANLHGDVLRVASEALVRRAEPGGWLVLSGILWEDDWAVRDAYTRLGCQLRRHLMRDEYSTLLFQVGVRHRR